jgi:serine/threonine protein kinase
MKPISIRTNAGKFVLDDVTYKIKHIETYNNGVNAYVVKCNITCVDELIEDKIIISPQKLFLYKKFFDKNNYIYEKITVNKITKKFNDENYEFYHNIIYYDNLNNIIIYDYLGETINENFNLNSIELINKLKIFKSLIEYCIVLKNFDILHNDIKPDNIVINNNLGLFVDYGNTLTIEELLSGELFDTTIWSASPEYYTINEMIINKLYNYNDENTKSMIYKSQIFPLAGILIGLIKNDIYYYFKTVYKHIYVKNYNRNNESNLLIRFKNFNVNKNNILVNSIQEVLYTMSQLLLNHEYIYNLIKNMLIIDTNKRISLDDILIELDKIINNNMNKIAM